MTWVRIDDAALSHPKIARAGVDGFGVWMGSLAYANRHVTDGFIPSDCLALLVPASWKLGETRLALIAERLVTLSLWHPAEGGWLIHGYSEYQEQALKVNVADRRERDAERKRQQRTREKRRESPPSHAVTPCDSHTGDVIRVTGDVTRGVTERVREASADARLPLSQPPDPSRPVPTRPDPVTKVTDGESASARTPTEKALRVGYQTRYQANTNDAWMAYADAELFIKRVGVWCDEQANPAEAVERFLDGAFANPSASMTKHRWPWKWLAEDPARTASFSTVATGALGEHPTLAASQKAAVNRIPTFTQEELGNAF